MELSALVRDLRQQHRLTVAQLAKKARVSNHSIIDIERGDTQNQYVGASPRKMRAVDAVIVRLAKAFGVPEATLLAAIAPRPTVVPSVIENTALGFDTWQWITTQLRQRPLGPLNIGTGILTYERNENAFSLGRNEFYKRLMEVLYNTISTSLNSVPVLESSPDQLCEGLRSRNRSLRAAVGEFNIVSRMLRGTAFIPVPGLQIRLSCWTSSSYGLTWSDVVEEVLLQQRAKGKQIRVLCVRGQAGYVYMRTHCHYRDDSPSFHPCERYDFDEIAERFQELLDQDKSLGTHTVFVNSEYGASAIVDRAQRKVKSSHRLIDIAADARPSAPYFRPSVTLAIEDVSWQQALSLAIDECFRNAASNMAQIYAEYFLGLYAEHEEALSRLAKDDKYVLPSFLLLHETSIKMTDDFVQELYARLQKGLRMNRALDDRFMQRLCPWCAPLRADRKITSSFGL